MTFATFEAPASTKQGQLANRYATRVAARPQPGDGIAPNNWSPFQVVYATESEKLIDEKMAGLYASIRAAGFLIVAMGEQNEVHGCERITRTIVAKTYEADLLSETVMDALRKPGWVTRQGLRDMVSLVA